MNRNSSPGVPMPDDLDQKYAEFFKAQVPQLWPKAPAASVEVARSAPQRESHPGRVTLAASFAGLLGLGLALSYGPTFQTSTNPSGGLLKTSNASGVEIQKHMAPEDQPKLPTP
jgi:hypothetical protein